MIVVPNFPTLPVNPSAKSPPNRIGYERVKENPFCVNGVLPRYYESADFKGLEKEMALSLHEKKGAA
jgi:hypothetical protein